MNKRLSVMLGLGAFAAVSATILWLNMGTARVLASQDSATSDPSDQLRFLVGSWSGTGDGNSGTSTLERSYEFILNDQFLLVRNKAVFPPQTKNPKGEIHEDLGVISYDKRRKTFILREFYSEGYVNQFVLDEISADGKKLVFTTEAVENGPPMMRARTTWEITGERSLNETFELAFDGQTFKPCVTCKLKRSH